ncbi:ubiquinol oxidase subunit II [Beijerinckia sp. L45]|uniref:ubiquinol oxidase subunit II n=1 Tax=Beijerinckia sp. L45 TaxID=1641855 RepID=UPI001FEF60F1|nr:ubiquinol oxidase subunit II [Beijerinckia sp. L45]
MVLPHVRFPRILLMVPVFGLLGGCNAVLLSPSGDVALQQRDLILASTALMLLIVIPVLITTVVFAWRYRASNTTAPYDPEWHHSTQLEVLIWTAPLLIIIALGALTWISTHVLDPFRAIERVGPGRPVAAGVKPLTVEVVALDWKWLFFYPDLGIATVNELAAPVDVPIQFKITSGTVMNSFFVPALAGQIYAMAGMETKLSAVINKTGDYDGFSANYSGAGFSHMNFKFHGLTQQDFDTWVAKAKKDGKPLDQAGFHELEKPTEAEPVHYYKSVSPGLYDSILNMCAEPGAMCATEMMHIDANGGGGKESEANLERLQSDKHKVREGNESPGATFPASGRAAHGDEQPQGMKARPNAGEANAQKTEPGTKQGDAMPGMPGMKKDSPAPAQLNN